MKKLSESRPVFHKIQQTSFSFFKIQKQILCSNLQFSHIPLQNIRHTTRASD